MEALEYKVISFNVNRLPKMKTKKERVQVGTEEKQGVFGSSRSVPVYEVKEVKKIDGYSQKYSDTSALVEEMQKTLNELAQQGWRVVSIQDVLRGVWEHASGGFGHGYSLTDSYVVVLERHRTS